MILFTYWSSCCLLLLSSSVSSSSYFFILFFSSHLWTKAVVTGVVPSSPRFLPSIFIAHRVLQQFHCSSIFHRVFVANSLSRFRQVNLCTRKSPHPIYTSTHSGGFELTKLTYIYTRLEDNLIILSGVLIRLTTCKRLTNNNNRFLPKLSLITLFFPPETRRDGRSAGYTGGPVIFPSPFIPWDKEYFSSSTLIGKV